MPNPTTLVVEDGTGKTDSNTYASLSYANSYLLDNPHTESWNDATDDQKTWALINATRLLDLYFNWQGSKQTTTQALEWPRTGGKNLCSGETIPDNYIPKNVVNATVELSYDIITSDKTRPSSTDQSQLSRIKVDVLELEYDTPFKTKEYSVNNSNVVTENLKAILRCFGTVGFNAGSSGIKFGRISLK